MPIPAHTPLPPERTEEELRADPISLEALRAETEEKAKLAIRRGIDDFLDLPIDSDIQLEECILRTMQEFGLV